MEIKKDFPKREKSIWQSIGPSIVSLGLGLGSGEFILWPFLVAHYGFGILWGALLGITIQIIMILEIQRYTAVQGEDIVEGFGKINKYLPHWLILSTLIGFGWPGFAATSSTLIVELGGWSTMLIPAISIGILILCAVLLLVGKNVYKTIEFFQKAVVVSSFIVLLYIFIQYFDTSLIVTALRGFIGIGEGYTWIPKDINLAVFIGAIAYAGAGGNMLLGQSFYTIEEDHGLAKYAKKFVLWGKKDAGKYADIVADEAQKSVKNFKLLRRMQVLEGSILFWGLGLITIFMLSYIAFVTLNGDPNVTKDFGFLVYEAGIIGKDLGQIWRSLFILIGISALISVQLGIYDMMGRISAVAIRAIYPKKAIDHNRIYVSAILIQMVVGILLFLSGLQEPLWLIVVGAVFNAFAMAVISLVVGLLGRSHLPKKYMPGIIVSSIMFCAAVFYTILFVVNV